MKTVFEKELEKDAVPINEFLNIAIEKVREVLEVANVKYTWNMEGIDKLRNKGKHILLIDLQKTIKAKEADDKDKKEKILNEIDDFTYHTFSRELNNKIVKKIIEKHL